MKVISWKEKLKKVATFSNPSTNIMGKEQRKSRNSTPVYFFFLIFWRTLSASWARKQKSIKSKTVFKLSSTSFPKSPDVQNGRRRRVASDRDWSGNDILVRGSVAAWSSRDHSERSGQQDDAVLCAFTDKERLVGDAAQNQVARNPTNTIFGKF
jgi:hypothetical protein